MWRALYSILLYALLPFIALRLLWRARRNPAYLRRWNERFLAGPHLPERPRLWVHAVSVGEVVAAVPLLRALGDRYPDHDLLVTTTTPTGAAELRRHFGDRVAHRYLPLDMPHVAGPLVRALGPRLLVVMETELWPNLYAACRRRGVPVMLVNGRLSDRSFAGYLRVRPLVTDTLRAVTALAARSEADAERFRRLGADPMRIRVTGDVKYDLESSVASDAQVETLQCQTDAGRPVWIAASTHEGEDRQVLSAHRRVRRAYPDALVILVPRHPERFEDVVRLCTQEGHVTARRSRGERVTRETSVWVGDTMGELRALFGCAQLAFMGGSLVPAGGHNPLEAAVRGLPVLTGPHVFNFSGIMDALLHTGGAQTVADEAALATAVIDLLGNAAERESRGRAAARVVSDNRGAVEQVTGWIGEMLDRAPGG